MTGKEYYRQAEKLLDAAIKESDARVIATLQVRAQVHATLAVAAGLLGTLEEQQVGAMVDEKIDQAIRDHIEDAPHIYPDGSTS